MTANEFRAWRHSVVGHWFFDQLQKEVDEIRRGIGTGSAYGDSPEKTANNYANMIGYCDGIQLAIERDPFDEIESDRTPSSGEDGAGSN